MESKNSLSVPDDHYSAAIDFSNACREFYINRVRATESFKEQMKEEEKSKEQKPLQRKRSSIDIAMETLRKEMVSACRFCAYLAVFFLVQETLIFG